VQEVGIRKGNADGGHAKRGQSGRSRRSSRISSIVVVVVIKQI
jgi:hypothetical protein